MVKIPVDEEITGRVKQGGQGGREGERGKEKEGKGEKGGKLADLKLLRMVFQECRCNEVVIRVRTWMKFERWSGTVVGLDEVDRIVRDACDFAIRV